MAKEGECCSRSLRIYPKSHAFLRVPCPASTNGFVLLVTKAEAAESFSVSPIATAELTRSAQTFIETVGDPLLVTLHETGSALFRRGKKPRRFLPRMKSKLLGDRDPLALHLHEVFSQDVLAQNDQLERLRQLLPTFGVKTILSAY